MIKKRKRILTHVINFNSGGNKYEENPSALTYKMNSLNNIYWQPHEIIGQFLHEFHSYFSVHMYMKTKIKQITRCNP